MTGYRRGLRGFHRHITGYGLLLAAFAVLPGCASMGAEGNTRAATARALGLAPGDVIIVSRSYAETGPATDDLALANYTIQTSAGFTYVCDMQALGMVAAPKEPVCKRKPK